MMKAKLVDLVILKIKKLYKLYKHVHEQPMNIKEFEYWLVASIKRCGAEIMEPFFIYDSYHNIVGFCICCFDSKIQFIEERSAFFTHIWLTNVVDVAEQLLKHLRIFMQKVFVNRIIGPIHDSIIFERSLKTFESALVFTGMPSNKSYIPSILLDTGFKKEQDLIEIVYKNTELQPRIAKLATKLKKNFKDIELILVDGSGILERSNEIAAFYNSEWSQNWGFQPITENDINTFCKSIPYNKNNAILSYYDHKLIGFCMTLEEDMVKHARAYFIGSAKPFRNTGLSVYMMILVNEMLNNKGIKLTSCAWMLESNVAVNKLITKFFPLESTQKRIYNILTLYN